MSYDSARWTSDWKEHFVRLVTVGALTRDRHYDSTAADRVVAAALQISGITLLSLVNEGKTPDTISAEFLGYYYEAAELRPDWIPESLDRFQVWGALE